MNFGIFGRIGEEEEGLPQRREGRKGTRRKRKMVFRCFGGLRRGVSVAAWRLCRDKSVREKGAVAARGAFAFLLPTY